MGQRLRELEAVDPAETAHGLVRCHGRFKPVLPAQRDAVAEGLERGAHAPVEVKRVTDATGRLRLDLHRTRLARELDGASMLRQTTVRITQREADVAALVAHPGALLDTPAVDGERLRLVQRRQRLVIAVHHPQAVHHADVQGEQAVQPRFRRGDGGGRGETTPVVCDCLVVRTARCGMFGRETPVAGRFADLASRPVVVRENFRFVGGTLWIQRFDGIGDARMHVAASAEQEALEGGVLHQRMLEHVACERRLAVAEHQPGVDQPHQRVIELRRAQRRHRGEQRVLELASDDGAELRRILDTGTPIEPRHE